MTRVSHLSPGLQWSVNVLPLRLGCGDSRGQPALELSALETDRPRAIAAANSYLAPLCSIP